MIHSQFFFNRCFDKGKLKGLISWSLRNYGEATTLDLVEKLKDVGFLWATKAGISLSIDDLKIPKEKGALLLDAEDVSMKASQQFLSGNLTTVERLQQLIDAWHRTSENLKQEVVSNFRRTDPLNPVYMMAFSGARGNISQVRQLVGMRGLMADPQGRIIDFPIRSNFREGLTLTEYVISCYGARKGIVDTALRTATSGYLTRRLVDVAQHVVVSLYDCETKQGIPLTSLKQGAKTLLPLSERILGRVLAEDVPGVATRNTCISEYLSSQLAQAQETIIVRSPLLCKSRNGICQLCYGWSLAHNELVSIGEAVGIIAAQSIGEPGTQLTMRTFHTGGVFSGEIIDQVQTPISGLIKFPKPLKGSLVRTSYGKIGFLTREAGVLSISSSEKAGETKELKFPTQSILFVRQGQSVTSNEILFEYAASGTDQDQGIQSTQLVISPQKGEVFFEDVIVVKDELNTDVQSYELGSFWLLTSHLHTNTNNTVGSFAYTKGDLIFENAPVRSTKLFNLTSDFATLRKEIYSTKQSNRLLPKVHFKISDLFISEIFYQNGNYSTLLNQNFHSTVHLSSEKQSFLSFLDKTIFSIFGFSGFLRDNFDDRSVQKPALSLLLANKKFSFLLAKPKISISTSFLRTKSAHFVQSSISSPQNQFYSKPKVKHLGEYLFKRKQQKVSLPFENIQKFYSSNQVVQQVLIAETVEFWSFSVNQFSFNKLKTGLLSKNQFSFGNQGVVKNLTQSSQELGLKRTIYRPLLNQVPLYFLFSLVSARKTALPAFAQILLNQTKTLSTGFSTLSQKVANLHFLSSSLTALTTSAGILNKQTLDKSLITEAAVDFSCDYFQTNQNLSCFILQIQPNLALDSLELKLCPTEVGKISIFGTSKILLPTNLTSILKGEKTNEFAWRYSKRKLANNQVILAQLDKKALDTFEIFKVSKTTTEEKILSFKKPDLTGILVPNSLNYLPTISLGTLVRPGTEIVKEKTFDQSGQIISLRKNSLLIRKATPILFSSKAIFHVFHGDFIEKGLPLITLTYKRLTTGDIVQGIPRIEQLFEARQTTTLLHEQLHELFETYKTRMRLDLAARKSFQKIQRILIDSIQRVYQSQGVIISDKHLEVIVRQMTSTVRILEGGRTRLLRGELKPIDWIEKINLGIDIQKAEYEPILLGITKASLETESFISAASFQETTRTLSRAAIEGRTDFLRGLKENVILGHRVPAGTGAPLISYLTKFSTSSDLNRDVSSDLSFLLKE